ncbi:MULTISPECIES: hypothetical protein [Nostocales]|nr:MULTISPECIES: hypothetical protein [Nostocales]
MLVRLHPTYESMEFYYRTFLEDEWRSHLKSDRHSSSQLIR